jgi:hypothetical protein
MALVIYMPAFPAENQVLVDLNHCALVFEIHLLQLLTTITKKQKT